jgi:hypothetical protein
MTLLHPFNLRITVASQEKTVADLTRLWIACPEESALRWLAVGENHCEEFPVLKAERGDEGYSIETFVPVGRTATEFFAELKTVLAKNGWQVVP